MLLKVIEECLKYNINNATLFVIAVHMYVEMHILCISV